MLALLSPSMSVTGLKDDVNRQSAQSNLSSKVYENLQHAESDSRIHCTTTIQYVVDTASNSEPPALLD